VTLKLLPAINEIFIDVFDDPSIEVNESTSASDVDNWDSLAQIRLIVSIEKYFNLRFNSIEISNLRNVGDLINLINQKLERA
jgi:acyl carrier protein